MNEVVYSKNIDRYYNRNLYEFGFVAISIYSATYNLISHYFFNGCYEISCSMVFMAFPIYAILLFSVSLDRCEKLFTVTRVSAFRYFICSIGFIASYNLEYYFLMLLRQKIDLYQSIFNEQNYAILLVLIVCNIIYVVISMEFGLKYADYKTNKVFYTNSPQDYRYYMNNYLLVEQYLDYNETENRGILRLQGVPFNAMLYLLGDLAVCCYMTSSYDCGVYTNLMLYDLIYAIVYPILGDNLYFHRFFPHKPINDSDFSRRVLCEVLSIFTGFMALFCYSDVPLSVVRTLILIRCVSFFWKFFLYDVFVYCLFIKDN